MIEVIPDRPEITAELALSAARIVKEYCRETDCGDCAIYMMCDTFNNPSYWDIPEREVKE